MEELKKALKFHGDAKIVAELAGLAPTTVTRIANGDIPNPGIATASKIRDALKLLPKERSKRRAAKEAAKKAVSANG